MSALERSDDGGKHRCRPRSLIAEVDSYLFTLNCGRGRRYWRRGPPFRPLQMVTSESFCRGLHQLEGGSDIPLAVTWCFAFLYIDMLANKSVLQDFNRRMKVLTKRCRF